MKFKKSVIPSIILGLTLILSLITPTAAVDGTLSVSVTPQPVHVGDTVYITVTASNEE